MELISKLDNEKGFGMHDIIFCDENYTCVVGQAIKMYYSGHAYHSRYDSNYEFKAALLSGTHIYVHICQTIRGHQSKPDENRFYKSENRGRTWVEVQVGPEQFDVLCSIT